jgi:hypothetical protein
VDGLLEKKLKRKIFNTECKAKAIRSGFDKKVKKIG